MEMYLSFVFFFLLPFFKEGLTANENILKKRETENSKDAEIEDETPLFLTPFLERKSIVEAREKARVQHSEIKNIESYSGYLTVNKDFNSNLFFWYFPSKGNSTTDPLILWLQGGPGQSSLYGLFIGTGPFKATRKNTLKLRNITWVNNHNMLYIDSPVGTGFSFTDNKDGYATTSENVAHNLYIALQQFFELFPELRKNDFYVMGESYGGKYVPVLSYLIHETNKNNNTHSKINLVGLAIGNGLTDPINQLAYSKYLYQIGLIDENVQDQMREMEVQITDLIKAEKYFEAHNVSKYLVTKPPSLFSHYSGFLYFFNYLYTREPEHHYWYQMWIQKPSVHAALHVGNRGFIPSSMKVHGYLSGEILKSVAKLVATLLEDYRVLIYYGQLDIICAYPNAENYLKKLDWSGAEEYKKAVRNLWFVEDQLAGYTKSVRNLTEVLVRNAGHVVPADQPLWAWKMITNFTHYKNKNR